MRVMSSIIDRIINDVCLDERVSDGIFNLENNNHMDALWDYFIKKGIPHEDATTIRNRMVEGKFPERQAYSVETGKIITWPTPELMQKALAKPENKDKYTLKDPNPKRRRAEKEKEMAPSKDKPAFDEPKNTDDEKNIEEPSEKDIKEPTIFQGDKELKIEPPGGEKSIAPDDISSTPSPQNVDNSPKTPAQIAANKEVIKQIINTDDTAISNIADPLDITKENICKIQLTELCKYANELGFREAVEFLKPHINS